mmetsp:Transcript_33964/g.112417  ORF Transcript_33964/g.112417 Transcript_33964/m.112417 type:complete len:214 (-) Transcript_33964:1603-2244(-)
MPAHGEEGLEPVVKLAAAEASAAGWEPQPRRWLAADHAERSVDGAGDAGGGRRQLRPVVADGGVDQRAQLPLPVRVRDTFEFLRRGPEQRGGRPRRPEQIDRCVLSGLALQPLHERVHERTISDRGQAVGCTVVGDEAAGGGQHFGGPGDLLKGDDVAVLALELRVGERLADRADPRQLLAALREARPFGVVIGPAALQQSQQLGRAAGLGGR